MVTEFPEHPLHTRKGRGAGALREFTRINEGERISMTESPTVVVHVRDATLTDSVREAIDKQCGRLVEEFKEVKKFEITISGNGVGFEVHGRATGKNTEIATHAIASEPGPAADQLFDKIERQLRKVHDKRIFSQRRSAQKDPPKRKVTQ
jgi:ribosomal subunit interface protein